MPNIACFLVFNLGCSIFEVNPLRYFSLALKNIQVNLIFLARLFVSLR